MISVEQIISARWLLPVRPKHKILEHSSLVISGGRILDILPTSEVANKYYSSEVVNLPEHAIMPGMVNAHTHTPMVLLRGLGDGAPLKTWLEKYIWPAEQKLISKEFIADGTRLGIAEMLLNGTTCFSEHYFMPECASEVVQDLGIRALIGIGMHDDLPNNDSNYDLAKQLFKVNDPLLSYAFAPHSPYMLSDKSLRRMVDLCEEAPLPIHIHLHETMAEISNSVEIYGKRPIARLKDLGLFEQHLIAVHMVHIDESDLDILADNFCHVVTCPDSNLKLGSGICNIKAMQDIGLNIAVGTDGAASNNDLDILAEARNASLLNRSLNSNASLSPAVEVLDMLTINGALALGLASEVGSLEIGKAADIIALKLDAKFDVLEQVIFAANCRSVSDVWVNGKRLLNENQFTNLDMEHLLDLANSWQIKTQTFTK